MLWLAWCCLASVSCQPKNETQSTNMSSREAALPSAVSTSARVAVGSEDPNERARAPVDQEQRGAVRPYVNDRLNGRVGEALPNGTWEVRWQVDLSSGLRPFFVLHAGGRTLVQGRDLWQLFDDEGQSIAVQRVAASDVVLDPDRGLIYNAASNGTLVARTLADGEPAYTLGLLFGPEFERVFFSRRGDRMVVASVEHPVDVHEAEPVKNSLVEVHELGDPVRTDDIGIVTSSRRLASLNRKADEMRAAMHGDTLVVATPGQVEYFDLGLASGAKFTGDFEPLSMSVDEAGRSYLLVREPSDAQPVRQALWVVAPDGGKVIDVEVPAQLDGEYPPPVVGYDHNVYLAFGDSIRAVSPQGEMLWTQHAGGPVGGATVTADDQLLVAAGGMLASWNPKGERTLLFFLEGERWITPPILTGQGRILIATEKHLYCLGRRN